MTKTVGRLALAGVLAAAQAVAFAQGGDVNKIVADARQALGGDRKLDAVQTIALSGHMLRTTPNGASFESDFEIAIELPDKYMRREAVVNMGNMSVYRTSGFNGDGVINEMDTPPQLAGGVGHVVMFKTAGAGGTASIGGGAPTPEQQETMRRNMLASSRQDFARLALGMFVKPFASYPLSLAFAGRAESPDGTADIVDVKGDGDFAARLFVDSATHLPLMLSWMAKEPLMMFRQVSGGGGNVVTSGTGPGPVQALRGNLTPEEREKAVKQLEEQAREAEARRKVVEYRMFYSEYRSVDGVKIPHRIQRSVDGKPTEELTFEKVKVNSKIDARKFAVTK